MCTLNVLNMLKIKIFNRKLTIKKRIKFSLFNNKKKRKIDHIIILVICDCLLLLAFDEHIFLKKHMNLTVDNIIVANLSLKCSEISLNFSKNNFRYLFIFVKNIIYLFFQLSYFID